MLDSSSEANMKPPGTQTTTPNNKRDQPIAAATREDDDLVLNLVVTDWVMPVEAEEDSSSFVIEISGLVSDPCSEKPIGWFRVYQVYLEDALAEGHEIDDVLDAYSATNDFSPIFTSAGRLKKSVRTLSEVDQADRLLILDRLAFLPEHRGRKIGVKVISVLINRFGGRESLVLGKSFPLQFESTNSPFAHSKQVRDGLPTDPRTAKASLRAYHERIGFRFIGKSNLMVLPPAR